MDTGSTRVGSNTTLLLIILSGLSSIETGDSEFEIGRIYKGDVGTSVKGLVMGRVPVGTVDNLERRLVASLDR